MTDLDDIAPFYERAASDRTPPHGEVVRWVAPVSSDIRRTKHGLLDSLTLSRAWYAGDQPKRSNDLVGTPNSYALLAPGGAGKTTLITDLKRREPGNTSIDLRLHGRPSLAELLNLLPEKPSPLPNSRRVSVFIDSVDEALQVDPNIGYMLVNLAKHPGLDHIAWRFACRPSSWTVDLSDGMSAVLPGFEELELLPLSLPELREMAGDDADDFLDAAEQASLTRLLALPQQASNLLHEWRSSRRMPASRAEAMDHAVTRLLAETNGSRLTGKLDDRRRRLIAERLAATSVFCNVGSYAPKSLQPGTETGIGSSSLSVSSLPTDAEPDLAESPLTPSDFHEVLGTGLFTTAGQGAVTFTHQSYVEFLAAAYLVRRGVVGQRLISMLGADANGLVPGSRIQILSWLLASRVTVPDALISDNAKQLLDTTELELVDDRVRERIVDAILRGAADGTIYEGWQAETSVLAHPGLADQLHDALQSASSPLVISWACRIARQCSVHEAADDLLAIALNPAWSDVARAEAVRAFGGVAPRQRISELAPLVDLATEEDPLDEILAAALRAMLPNAIEIDRIQSALRPRRAPRYIGAYRLLLGELSTLIPSVAVIPTLVDALSRRPEYTDGAFDDLLCGLVQRAWDMRDSSVVEVVGAALGSDRLGFPQRFRDDGLPWERDDDPVLRRVMAVAALAAHENAFAAVSMLRMLTPSDLVWLIDWMGTASQEALHSAQIVLRHLAWNVADSETVDRILAFNDQDHPAYQELRPLQGHRGIDSRPDWVARQIEYAESRPSTEESVSELREAVAHARADINDWWYVGITLAGLDPDIEHLVSWDLTSRPLWSTLIAVEQDEILQLGLNYINGRQPEVDRWVDRDQLTNDQAMPDWAAVFLLATMAVHRPDLLDQVEPTTWTSWASVIILMPQFPSQENWQARIRGAAPTVGRDAIEDALREHIRGAGASFAHHPLTDLSDPRLLEVIEEVARDAAQPESRRGEAMVALTEYAPDIALEIARAAMDEDSAPPAAFATLAKLAPEELVAGWIAQHQLGALEQLRDLNIDRLSDETLAAVTALVLSRLPFAEDADEPFDFTEVTTESAARRMRVRLLQAMAARGMSSSLAALGQNRAAADREQIRYLLPEARSREALAHWTPLELSSFMEVIARGDARLVRDSAGLIRVLLEQLDDIQHDILERAAYRSLWDREPGTEGASPKVEDTISDWLADQLRLRLRPHVVVDREIQVTRRSPKGFGTRIDITATSGGREIGRVVFEAKRVNNDELLTGIDDQLVGKYMAPLSLTYGVYIVYWTAPELRPPSWDSKHPDPNTLANELRIQAERHHPRRHLEVVVLNIGPAA